MATPSLCALRRQPNNCWGESPWARGHAGTRMTERHYAHLSPSYVAETIRASFPTLGIVEKSNAAGMKSHQR